MRHHISSSCWIVFTLSILFVAMVTGASAGIYKYQDADGNWHFTDNPYEVPQDSEKLEGVIERNAGLIDLKEKWDSQYGFQSVVEKATLSIVQITSSIGTGTGFFISDDGYILTNKHVLRGDEEAIHQANQTFRMIDENIQTYEESLIQQESDLKRFENNLTDLKGKIEASKSEREKSFYEAQYKRDVERYRIWKRNIEASRAEYEQGKTDYDRKKNHFRRTTITAGLISHFAITLYDDTEHDVYLVAESTDHDLALLKLDGYTTPFIEPMDPSGVRRGESVYAIGNPINFRNSVSKGVVSGFEQSYIRTDAKIYPGNSGGPLITQEGRAIGINTMKKLTHKFEGIGFALPIDLALEEFKEYLKFDGM